MEPTATSGGAPDARSDTLSASSENGSIGNHSPNFSLHLIAKAKAEAKDALIDHLQHQLEVKEEMVGHLQTRLEELNVQIESLQKTMDQTSANAEVLRKKNQSLTVAMETQALEGERLRAENARLRELLSPEETSGQPSAPPPAAAPPGPEAPGNAVLDTLHRFGLLMTLQQLGSSVSAAAIQQSVGALSAVLGPALQQPGPGAALLGGQSPPPPPPPAPLAALQKQLQLLLLQQQHQLQQLQQSRAKPSPQPTPKDNSSSVPSTDDPSKASEMVVVQEAGKTSDIFDPEHLLRRMAWLVPTPPTASGSDSGLPSALLGHPFNLPLAPASPVTGSQCSSLGLPADALATASPSRGHAPPGWEDAPAPPAAAPGRSPAASAASAPAPAWNLPTGEAGQRQMRFPQLAADSQGEPTTTSPRSLDCSAASPMGGQDQSPAYSAYDDDEDLRSEEGDFGAADSTPSGQDSTPAGGRRLLEDRKYKTQNETRLIEIVVGLLEDNAMNPYKGSVPVERIQNVVRSQHNQLYNLIVGSRHNSWKRFLEFHPKVFHLFCVDDGKWRMRLVKHGAWKEADLQEQEERQLKECHLIDCLTAFLRQQPTLSCRVDDFRLAYPTLPRNQPREGVAEPLYPLPARGDLTRFVRRHPNHFVYDKDNFSIILKEKDSFNFLLKPGPDEGSD
eukprot:EG_transcript_2328